MRIMGTIAGIALAVALAACSTDDTGSDTQDEPDSQTDEATATAGTRENPYTPGDTLDLGDWTITLSETNLDATAEVLAANGLNEIEDGHTAIMVEVEATYNGDDSATVWADIGISWVGGDGNSYDSSNAYCGPVDNGLLEAREQFTDATVTGNVCVAVPPEAAADGTWRIEPLFDRDVDEVFVAVD